MPELFPDRDARFEPTRRAREYMDSHGLTLQDVTFAVLHATGGTPACRSNQQWFQGRSQAGILLNALVEYRGPTLAIVVTVHLLEEARMHSITWYPDEDILYVRLSDEADVAGRMIDSARVLHVDASGSPAGIEFLYASDGINLDGLPVERRALEGVRQWLSDRNVKVA